ncbi:hypothetical protein RRG08_037093 [Elysia crispata]|uniref:Endonuclease/exonuclease/phosphatase domain-containing protein n=1 Tax=Elysia crispata TaxID=231223 RepID=A0AAE1CTB0_9GAST|nr:hypothetical protein RRG08_037093 [Elysia crispata]
MQITRSKIIQDDFNAKVGKGRRDDIIGEYRLGENNERGDRLFEWAKMNEMIIGNTWFEHHPRRLWTWLSNDDETKNQIDYILIDKRFRNGMINIKTLPRADCNSDHNLLMSKIKIKLKSTSKAYMTQESVQSSPAYTACRNELGFSREKATSPTGIHLLRISLPVYPAAQQETSNYNQF